MHDSQYIMLYLFSSNTNKVTRASGMYLILYCKATTLFFVIKPYSMSPKLNHFFMTTIKICVKVEKHNTVILVGFLNNKSLFSNFNNQVLEVTLNKCYTIIVFQRIMV